MQERHVELLWQELHPIINSLHGMHVIVELKKYPVWHSRHWKLLEQVRQKLIESMQGEQIELLR